MPSLSEKLKAMYQLQDSLPKLIEDVSIPDQKLDDYYVKLNMLVETTNEKVPIKLEEIFTAMRDEKEESTVLVVGDAGIGKSSFLQNIVYKWGKGSLFSDKFDFVFKVKLKRLLSVNEALQSEDITNWFAKLVSFSLIEQHVELAKKIRKLNESPKWQHLIDLVPTTFDLQEFSDALNNNENKSNKTLVLLDGYDEVAHSLSVKSIDCLFYQISSLKNVHVLMTSRPSGINYEVNLEFKRKIECTGFNRDGVIEYINRYFNMQNVLLSSYIDKYTAENNTILNELKVSIDPVAKERYCQLKSILGDEVERIGDSKDNFKATIVEHCNSSQQLIITLLETNISLFEIAIIPINIAMLCLICSDHSVIQEFSGDFNSGRLYQEVLNWLSKRYLLKNDLAKTMKDLSLNDIYNVEELKILKFVAGESFKVDKYSIKGGYIHDEATRISTKRTIRIKEVYDYGLLRSSGGTAGSIDGDDLIKQEHSFVHLSFQEYLTACYFKELLLNEDKHRDTSEFIGQHRNEPKYLLTLKFLAGIVTVDTSTNRDLLVQRFWESVTCNVDQVIELGLKGKVTLLMHLLSQAKIYNKVDSKIPNIRKIKELIDVAVISDITEYQEALTASGYFSDTIKEALLASFHLDYEWKLNYLKTLRQDEQTIESKNHIDHIIILANKNIDVIEQDNIRLETISEEDKNKEQARISFLRKIELEKVILVISKLISSGNIQAGDLSTDAVTIEADTDGTTSKASQDMLTNFIHKLLDLFLFFNWQIKKAVINAIYNILGNIQFSARKRIKFEEANKIVTVLKWHITDENLKEQVYHLFKLIISITDDKGSDVKIECYVNKAILNQYLIFHKNRKIEEVVDDELVLFKNIEFFKQEVLISELVAQCKHPNWILRYHSYLLLNKILHHNPNLISILYVADNLLIGYKDDDSDVILVAAGVIGFIVEKRPELITTDIINKLINRLSDSDSRVRQAAAAAGAIIVSIAEKRPEIITTNIVHKLFKLFINMWSDSDSDMRLGTVRVFASIAEKRPELITTFDIVDKVIIIFSNNVVREVADVAVVSIAEMSHELITTDNIYKLTDVLGNMDFNVERQVNKVVSRSISKEVKISEFKATDFVDNLTYLSHKIYSRVRQAAARAIIFIAEKRPELITTAIIDKLINRLSDYDSKLRQVAAEAIESIAEKRPGLITTSLLLKLINILSDSNFDVRQAAARAIIFIAEKRPELITTAIAEDKLFNMLSDSYSDVGQSAVRAFEFIAEKRPELITTAIVDKLLSTDLSYSYSKLRRAAARAIGFIAEKRPELITTAILDKSINMLSDSYSDVGQSAARAIGSIAEKRPELITTAVVDKVFNMLSDSDSNVRLAAVSVIGTISAILVEKKLELIATNIVQKLFQLFINMLSDREAVVRAFGFIAETRSDLEATDIIDKLINMLNDSNFHVRREVLSAIGSIAEKKPELITADIVYKLIDILSYNDARRATAVANRFIAEKRPELVTTDNVNKLFKMLSDSNFDVRLASAEAIKSIAEKRPELVTTDIIDKLIKMLSDSNFDVRLASAEAIKTIAEKRPGLITTSLLLKLINILNDSNSDIRQSATEAIGSIAEKKPELITGDIIDKLIDILSDSNSRVRLAAARAIGSIVGKRPELITTDIIDKLIKMMSDSNSKLRQAAVVIGSIAGAAVVIGSMAGEAVAIGFMAGAAVVFGSMAGAAVVIGTMAGTAVAIGSIAGVAVAIGSGAAVVIGSMAGAAAIIGSMAGAAVFIGSIAGLAVAVGSGAAVVIGFMAGAAVVFGSMAGEAVVIGSMAREVVAIGSMAGAAVGIGSMAGEAVANGYITGVAAVFGSMARVAVVIGSMAEAAVVIVSMAGEAVVFGSMAEAAVVIGSMVGAAVAIGSMAGVAVAIGSMAGAAVVIGFKAGEAVVFRSIARVAVVIGSIAGVAVVFGSMAGAAVAIGFMAREAVAIGSMAGEAVAFGSMAREALVAFGSGAAAIIGSMAGVAVVFGSMARVAVVIGSIAGVAVVIGSMAGEAVAIGSMAGAAVVIGFKAGEAVVFRSIARVAVVIGSIAGVAVVFGSMAGAAVAIGFMAGAAVAIGSMAREALVAFGSGAAAIIGSMAGVAAVIGSMAGASVAIGSMAGAAAIIGYIAGKRHESITTKIAENFFIKMSDSDYDIRQVAGLVVRCIVEKSPDLITPDIIVKLINMLSDSNSDVRLAAAAAEAIGFIAEKIPELITTDLVWKLFKMLSVADEDWYSPNISQAGVLRAIGYIVEKRPELITADIIDELINRLSDYDSKLRQVAAEAIGSIAEKIPELITTDIIVKLINMLSDSDSAERQAATGAVRSIAEKRPELITTEIIDKLINMSSDSNFYVRLGTIRIFGFIAEKRPELVPTNIVGKLISMLSDSNSDIGQSATEAIGSIAEKRPGLITTSVLDKLINMLSDSNSKLRQAAARAIGSIAEKRPGLITTSVLDKLISMLSDSNSKLGQSATEAIGSIAEKRPELITTDIIDKLISMLSDSNSKLRQAAARAIGSIAEKRPELITTSVLDKLINMLSDSNSKLGQAAARAIVSIAEKRPELITADIIDKLGGLFSFSESYVRESACILLFSASILTSVASLRVLGHGYKATRVFVQQVYSAILNNKDEKSKVKVKSLLRIISFYDPKDPEKKALLELARGVLRDKVTELTEKDISDITSDFKYLLSLSSESKNFMMKLLERVLRDSKIAPVEKDFIIESLQHGIALSFKKIKNNQIKIMLDGVTYFFEDDVSRGYVEEILRAALAQENDILVSQYTNYTPLFENSGNSMNVATIDNRGVTSIVKKKNMLISGKWIITLMHYASVTDEVKLDPDRIFILLERRNEFGEVQIEKITRSERCSWVEHPAKVNDDKLRLVIFGAMEYTSSKPRYYSTSITATYQQGVTLLGKIGVNHSTLTYGSSYFFVRDMLSESNILSPLAKAELGLTLEWERYIYHPSTLEWTKEDVLITIDCYHARQDSFNFDSALKLSSHIQLYKKNKKWMKARFSGLSDELTAIRDEMISLHKLKETFESEIKALIPMIKTEGGNAFSDELIRKLETIDAFDRKIEELQKSKDTWTLAEFSQKLDAQKQEMNRLATDLKRHHLEIGRITAISNEMQTLKEKGGENTVRISVLSSQIDLLMESSEEMTKTKLELSQLKETKVQYNKTILEIARNSDDYASSIKRLESILVEGTSKNEGLLALERRLELQDSQLTNLLISDTNNSSSIQDLLNEMALNKGTVVVIRSQVAEHSRKLEQLQRILKDAAILESMITKEKLAIKDWEELQIILSDPYQEAFYNALKWQLNATYLAATVVQTDIVTNSQTGTLDNVGSAVTTLAPYVPLIGLGVQLLGYVLTYADKALQSKMVANFARIATSSEEMSELVDKIARKIVTSKLNIKDDDELLASLFRFANETVSHVNEVVAQSILDITSMRLREDVESDEIVSSSQYTTLQSFSLNFKEMWKYAKKTTAVLRKSVNNKSTGKQDGSVVKTEEVKTKEVKLQQLTEEESKIVVAREAGEKDAATVAQVLITKIYIGSLNDKKDIASKADFLIKFIKETYHRSEQSCQINTPNLDEDNRAESAIVNLRSTSTDSTSLEISKAILTRVNYLIKVKKTSPNLNLENDFTNALASAFRTTYIQLLESTERCQVLKTTVIEELASEFKKSKKIFLLYGQFLYIDGAFSADRNKFFKEAFASVLEILKETNYQDDTLKEALKIR